MFKAEVREELKIGYRLETAYAVFFFGNRNFTREAAADFFPQYRFAYLKQVHGNDVLLANASQIQEGDGHFTSERNLALVSQTADCTPILLANEESVCAIHSGWRGTELNICAAAKVAFPNSLPRIAAIGPHILKSSFEVGQDVTERLLNAAAHRDGLAHAHSDPTKSYFDLTELVRRQLRQAFGTELSIAEYLEDTVTNLEFHSFRRQKQQADRQYSFVVLKA
jgi:YfiH family protein